MKARKGFTLVEILIVVVILGILAAIVIPQFTDASTQAKESQLAADLQTLRSQIELYKIQHGDQLPSTGTAAEFREKMINKTDEFGSLDPDGRYGPYMREIATNPFATADANKVVPSATDPGICGWWLNTDTGAIVANDGNNADL